METMELGGGMDISVPLSQPVTISNPMVPPITEERLVPPKLPPPINVEKNISEQQSEMDSTPIEDVLPQTAPMAAAPAASMQNTEQQYISAQPIAQPMGNKMGSRFMNLTQEQMEALVAGVSAMAVMYKPVQEKIMNMIPQAGDGDVLSTVGLVIMGLIAAIMFYFGRRFAN